MSLPFDDNQLAKYLGGIQKSESGDLGPSTVNTFGFMGLYQMGAPALEDVGLLKKGASKGGNKALKDPKNWTIEDGYNTFLSNPEMQKKAMVDLTSLNYSAIGNLGKVDLASLSPEEQAGLLAVAHLKGVNGGVKTFLDGKITKDGYGTSTQKYFDLGKATQKGETILPKKNSQTSTDQYTDYFRPDVVKPGVVKDEEGFVTTAAASFRRENPISQFLSSPEIGGEIDENYNPLEDIKGYEEFAEDFALLPNKTAVDNYKSFLDEKFEDMRIQVEGNLAGSILGGISGAVLSPINLIPGVGLSSKLLQGSKAARATALAVGGGSLAAADEVLLHGTDPTRTIEESSLNTVGALALGGLLGGVLPAQRLKGFGAAERESVEIGLTRDPTVSIKESTAGAKQVNLEGEAIVKSNPVFNTAFGIFKETSPGLRVLSSTSNKGSRLANELFEHNFLIGKNLAGEATDQSVETLIKANTAKIHRPLWGVDQAYSSYRKEGSTPFGTTRNNFHAEVARTLRSTESSSNTFVKSATKKIRGHFDDVLVKLKKAGLVDESIRDSRFLYRTFNIESIIRDRQGFTKKLARAFSRKTPKITKFTSLLDQAEEVTDRILKGGLSNTEIFTFKGKIKDLDDLDIIDFLDNDLAHLLDRNTRLAETDIAFKEKFGSKSMDSQIGEVKDDYQLLIDQAGNVRAKEKLSKEMNKYIKDIEAIRDRIQGKFKLPDDPYSFGTRALKAAPGASFLAVGGSIALAQLADLGSLIISRGMAGAIGKEVVQAGQVLKGLKLSKADLLDIGIGHEAWMSSRAFELMGVADSTLPRTATDKLVEKGVGKFMNISLINQMNDWSRRLSAGHVANRMIKDIQKASVGKLSDKRLAALSKLGIDKGSFTGILEEFSAHSQVHKGLRIANMSDWGKGGDAFRIAVRQEVDNQIIIPGAADKSLWMSSPFGKVIGQFKGFSFAMQNRVLLPGLQGLDTEFVGRLVALTMMGVVADQARRLSSGRELETDPTEIILSGLDKSGVTGLLLDLNGSLSSFTGLGAKELITQKQRSRFGISDGWARLLGPSAGLVDNLRKSLPGVFRGSPTEREIKDLSRVIPGQNLFYLRWIIDQIRNKAAKELGR